MIDLEVDEKNTRFSTKEAFKPLTERAVLLP